MEKNVVLFLTTPNSHNRIKMCLENFKQLEKLGYDIITLTTTDCLPDYIYERSKLVIHDYNELVCSKKDYYKYFVESNGYGYFFWNDNYVHEVRFFQDTHFPSVFRNTRTLIHFAEALSYDKYFFVEDDHYFHDDDLIQIKNLFKKLDENDIIVFTFQKCSPLLNNPERVYCAWFHLAKTYSMNEIYKNVSYTKKQFLSDKNLYLNFYEYTFKQLIQLYKPQNSKLLELNDEINELFKNSSLNQIYSFKSLIDDARCNFIYDYQQNKRIFFYTSNGAKEPTNVKIYIDDHLFNENTLQPGCWYYVIISDEYISSTTVIVNDTYKKSFANLEIEDVIYNGKLT